MGFAARTIRGAQPSDGARALGHEQDGPRVVRGHEGGHGRKHSGQARPVPPARAPRARNSVHGPWGGQADTMASNQSLPPMADTMVSNQSLPPMADTMPSNQSLPPMADTMASNQSLPPMADTMASNRSLPPMSDTMASNQSLPPIPATHQQHARAARGGSRSARTSGDVDGAH
jgi:hypothetical protein